MLRYGVFPFIPVASDLPNCLEIAVTCTDPNSTKVTDGDQMAKKISRIVFSGDSFRSTNGNTDQIGNVLWLKARVGDLFAELTRLPQEIRLPLLGQSVAEILAIQDGALEPNLDNWARVFWDTASADLVSRIAEEYDGALVITLEMPPVLEDALNRAGIPWIDIGVSPMRFMPDWAFHIKTSIHFEIGSVRDCLLTPREIERYVAYVGAWYGLTEITEPTVVFFAQTLQDRTLIRDRRFLGKEDVLDTIVALRNENCRLLIKPHPWQASSDIVEALVEIGGEITSANTYALLASPKVEVATLSSSVGREARVFGRKVTIISPSVQDWAFSGVDVLRHALSPRFWGTLFGSAGIPVGSAVARDTNWLPNRIRDSVPQQGIDSAIWRDASDPILRA